MMMKARNGISKQTQWSRHWLAAVMFGVMTAISPLVSTASPIVTIIDDDAVCAAYLEQKPNIAAKLHEYVADGHEVASHALTHSPTVWKKGAATDIRAIEREIVEARDKFRGLGFDPETFVYPFGNFPKKVRARIFAAVKVYYPVAFNARGDINLPGKMYPLYVSRHPLRKHNSMFMTKRLIDEAVAADRAWVVILTHSANPDFSAERLEETIRYAQKSGAVFLTASAAWQQVKTWPMADEDSLPDYSLTGDLLNAAYFHLPLLLVCGAVAVLFFGVLLYRCFFRRRAQEKPAED